MRSRLHGACGIQTGFARVPSASSAAVSAIRRVKIPNAGDIDKLQNSRVIMAEKAASRLTWNRVQQSPTGEWHNIDTSFAILSCDAGRDLPSDANETLRALWDDVIAFEEGHDTLPSEQPQQQQSDAGITTSSSSSSLGDAIRRLSARAGHVVPLASKQTLLDMMLEELAEFFTSVNAPLHFSSADRYSGPSELQSPLLQQRRKFFDLRRQLFDATPILFPEPEVVRQLPIPSGLTAQYVFDLTRYLQMYEASIVERIGTGSFRRFDWDVDRKPTDYLLPDLRPHVLSLNAQIGRTLPDLLHAPPQLPKHRREGAQGAHQGLMDVLTGFRSIARRVGVAVDYDGARSDADVVVALLQRSVATSTAAPVVPTLHDNRRVTALSAVAMVSAWRVLAAAQTRTVSAIDAVHLWAAACLQVDASTLDSDTATALLASIGEALALVAAPSTTIEQIETRRALSSAVAAVVSRVRDIAMVDRTMAAAVAARGGVDPMARIVAALGAPAEGHDPRVPAVFEMAGAAVVPASLRTKHLPPLIAALRVIETHLRSGCASTGDQSRQGTSVMGPQDIQNEQHCLRGVGQLRRTLMRNAANMNLRGEDPSSLGALLSALPAAMDGRRSTERVAEIGHQIERALVDSDADAMSVLRSCDQALEQNVATASLDDLSRVLTAFAEFGYSPASLAACQRRLMTLAPSVGSPSSGLTLDNAASVACALERLGAPARAAWLDTVAPTVIALIRGVASSAEDGADSIRSRLGATARLCVGYSLASSQTAGSIVDAACGLLASVQATRMLDGRSAATVAQCASDAVTLFKCAVDTGCSESVLQTAAFLQLLGPAAWPSDDVALMAIFSEAAMRYSGQAADGTQSVACLPPGFLEATATISAAALRKAVAAGTIGECVPARELHELIVSARRAAAGGDTVATGASSHHAIAELATTAAEALHTLLVTTGDDSPSALFAAVDWLEYVNNNDSGAAAVSSLVAGLPVTAVAAHLALQAILDNDDAADEEVVKHPSGSVVPGSFDLTRVAMVAADRAARENLVQRARDALSCEAVRPVAEAAFKVVASTRGEDVSQTA